MKRVGEHTGTSTSRSGNAAWSIVRTALMDCPPPKPKWVVVSMKAHGDRAMGFDFVDGTCNTYNARSLLGGPFCARLKNPAFVLPDQLEYGLAVWDDEIHCALERLYELCTAASMAGYGARMAG